MALLTAERCWQLEALDDVPMRDTAHCDALVSSFRAECHRRNREGFGALRALRSFVSHVRHGERTLDLADCHVLRDPKAFAALSGALTYNRWCEALVVRDVPLRFAIAPALEYNRTLVRLELVNVGATRDDATALANALQANQRLALRELDLSQNLIEDRGITALSNWLSKTREGIARLRLADVGAGKQGLTLLLSTLENHHFHASTLVELDLSHNRAVEDTSRSLHSFLRKASALECLRLAAIGTLDVELCMRAESASAFW